MNKWQAFSLGAVIFTILTVLYFVFPPFGEAMAFIYVAVTTALVGFVLSYQPAWLGMTIGGTIIGALAVIGVKGYFKAIRFGFKKTIEPLTTAGLPRQTVETQSILASAQPQQPRLVAIEEKKQ